MRIAVAGFQHESNTFSTMPTDRAGFEAQCLALGGGFVADWRESHHEVGGFIEGVQRLGADMVPLLMAWAMPGGTVHGAIYEEIVAELSAGVRKAEADGLLLALHGAMVSEKYPDGDGEVVARLRRALGPDFPIVVTLDLHGNTSQQLVDNATAVIAYRTCPHVDQRQRGLQGAELMGRIVRREVKPVVALAKPPVIVNIMVHDTSKEPLKGVMEACRETEKKPGILAVSFLPGFAYADVPQMGPAFIVVADGNKDLARQEAERLGRMLWDMRERLVARLPAPAEAVRQALAETRTPVVLVDTGDNVGGGSAADGTLILQELLRQQATDAVVCLYAPEEVRQCVAAGIGSEVRLRVGGKLDRLHGDPMEVAGRVRVLHDGDYIERQARHGGRRLNRMGLSALVELPGRIQLVLSSQRHPPFSLGQLTCLGLQPEAERILVVKAAIAYKAAYVPIAGRIIEVDTPGLTAVNPRHFQYQHIRPLYPLVEVVYG